jgi:hypothetical protein
MSSSAAKPIRLAFHVGGILGLGGFENRFRRVGPESAHRLAVQDKVPQLVSRGEPPAGQDVIGIDERPPDPAGQEHEPGQLFGRIAEVVDRNAVGPQVGGDRHPGQARQRDMRQVRFLEEPFQQDGSASCGDGGQPARLAERGDCDCHAIVGGGHGSSFGLGADRAAR